MIRLLLSAASPSGPRARLATLIYHRVMRKPDPLFPEEMYAERFDETCRWLADWFNVLPLDEAVSRLRSGTLPPRSLAITFDDGYADNHDVALPILQRHGLCATFFIATGFLNGGLMWNDLIIESIRQASGDDLDLRGIQEVDLGVYPIRTAEQRRAAINVVIARVKYLPIESRLRAVAAVANCTKASLPCDLMMTNLQVRAMRLGGMQIGAHTESHPILASLPAGEAKDEIRRSKTTLEELLDERVSLLAYPNGKPGRDYGADAVRAAKELKFDAAVTTAAGVLRAGGDMFQIPRFTPWDRHPVKFGGRLAKVMLSAPPELVDASH